MDGAPARWSELAAAELALADELVLLVDRSGGISWVEGRIAGIDAALGRRIGELGFAGELARVHDELARCLAGASAWSGMLALIDAGGKDRLIACRVTPLRESDDGVSAAVVRLRDETELQRLRALAAGHNMADKVAQVFPGVRHELGNPVNSLKVALTVLRSNWTKMEAARVDAYYERMLGELARIEYLLEAMRSHSALEQPKRERVDVATLLRWVESLARSSRSPSGLDLVIEHEPALELVGDVRALHQVLLNLLSNALDAVAGRPRATLLLRAARRGEWVALEVIDEGRGIDPDLRECVGRPFFSTKREGSGLGLAIVGRLVAGMQGRFELEDRRGGGTIARVLLAPWEARDAR